MAVVRLICGLLAGMICSGIVAIGVAVFHPLPAPSVPAFGFPRVARDVPVAAANALQGGALRAADRCAAGTGCGSGGQPVVIVLPAGLLPPPSAELDDPPEPPDGLRLSGLDLMTP